MAKGSEEGREGGGAERLGLQGVRALAAALVVYALLVIPATILQREQINNDGIAYVRHAMYLAEGDFWESVSGYWSPLIIWSTAPFIRLGLDPVDAIHVAQSAWGLALVVGTWMLARRLGERRDRWLLGSGLLVAVAMVAWATSWITPDPMIAAWLLIYLSIVSSPRLLHRSGVAFGAGLAGGVAYLAKAYAFPYVLAHLPCTVILRWWMDRRSEGEDRATLGRAALAWAVAMLGFAVVAGPWVGVLSSKYEGFTFSTAGSRNHAIVGPGQEEPRHAMETGMWPPDPPHVTVWETPEALPYEYWSPFENLTNLKFQVLFSARTAWYIAKLFREYDFFCFAIQALFLVPVLALLVSGARETRFRALWILGSVVLYCAGYAAASTAVGRYFEMFLWPIAVVLAFWALQAVAGFLARLDRFRLGRERWVTPALITVVTISFALDAGQGAARELLTTESGAFRRTAAQLEAEGIEGPVAGNDWRRGVTVAFYLGAPHLGVPESTTPEAVDRELRNAGAKVLLVWEGVVGEEMLRRLPGWRHAARIEAWPEPPMDAYVPVAPATDR